MNQRDVILIIGITVLIFAGLAGGVLFLNQSNKDSDKTSEGLTYGTQTDNYSADNQTTPTNTNMPTQTQSSSNIVDAKSDYKVTMETDMGTIVLQLSKATPKTTGNFVGLAQKGFYDGTIFHRTINGFMIQGGDPEGNGTGGPGYKFNDEPFTGEYTRGTIAMANSGANTNGSQFFIMHKDNALPKNYVIFGKVIEGLETVDKIATAEVRSNMYGEASTPVSPVKIKKVTVEEMK
jgi:peptidylprolyl isomerase